MSRTIKIGVLAAAFANQAFGQANPAEPLPAVGPAIQGMVAEEVPTLESWVAGITKNPTVSKNAYPHKLIFLSESLDGQMPRFQDFDVAQFNRTSLVQVADPSSVSWAIRINIPPELQGKTKIPDEAGLMRLAAADGIVRKEKKGKAWQFELPEQKVTAPFVPPAKKKQDVREIQASLAKTLRYDGVILDLKGSYILVGSLAPFPEGSKDALQAVVLKDSAVVPILTAQSSRDGVAILQLEKFQGPYGIFKVLLGQNSASAIPLGSKVLIEKRKQ